MRILSTSGVMRAQQSAAALGLAAALVVAACGGSSTPAASPSPSPAPSVAASPAPSVAASVRPSAAGSPAPSVAPTTAIDPTEGMKINAPYALVALSEADAAQFTQGFQDAAGGSASLFQVGARQVTKNGSIAAVLLALYFPAQVAGQDAVWTTIEQQIAGTATLKHIQVAGVTVSVKADETSALEFFRAGNGLVVLIGATEAAVTDIAGALIPANQ